MSIIPDTHPVVAMIERIIGNPLVILGGIVAALIAPVVLLAVLLQFAWFKALLASQMGMSLIFAGLTVFILLHLAGLGTLAERKIASWMQDRIGPNRVGFWGILQPLADGGKFILKEDITPDHVDKPSFILAPFLAFTVAFITFAVIPWAGYVKWPWMPADAAPLHTAVANVDIGLLYMIAVGSMSVYGVVLGGWASNNKYSFYGGMRSTAQMLSYEVPLGLGLLIVFLSSGSLSGNKIIDDQINGVGGVAIWNIFMHPIAFILVLVAAFAETNRTPFDLAEAEQELVGGYHTEYSSMKLAVFLLSEYVHMAVNGALIMLLFFGGWGLLPFFNGPLTVDNHSWWAMLAKYAIIWGKISAMILFYIAIRWTIPRYRYDQLMRIAWKGLIPAGVAMLFIQAVLVAFNLHTHKHWYVSLGVNLVMIAFILAMLGRSKNPVTGRQENLPHIQVVPA
ncbi:MAG: complex I subunit 1 family protein [Phycisphaerae bacterium]|nr:complex I subunit 1 family protein [Phycisphaerae bacterium]